MNFLMFSAVPWMIMCSFSSRKVRFVSSASCFSFSAGRLGNGLTRIHFWSRGTPVMNFASSFSSFSVDTLHVWHLSQLASSMHLSHVSMRAGGNVFWASVTR